MEIALVPLFAAIAYFGILIPGLSLAVTLFAAYSHISIFIGPVFLPLVAITLASFILYKLFKRDLTIAYLPINKFVFLFIATIFFSLFFTQDWERATYDLFIFLKSLVLFFLIVNIAKDENTIIHLIETVVVAVLCGSIIALSEYHTTMHVFLFSGRTGSVLEDPNFFASMLVSVLPFSIFLFKRERNLYLKSFWGVCSVFQLFSIVPTFSRGGIIGLVVILFLVVLHERKNKWTWIVLPLVILIFAIVVPFDFWIRIMTLINTQYDRAIGHRLLLMKSGIKVFSQYPIIGVGTGDFINAISRYMNHPMVAHNMYLHVFVETGIIGGTFFLCILGNVLWSLHRAKQISDLAAYMEISLIGLFVTAFFLSIHFHFWVWALLGIVSAFLRIKLWRRPYWLY